MVFQKNRNMWRILPWSQHAIKREIVQWRGTKSLIKVISFFWIPLTIEVRRRPSCFGLHITNRPKTTNWYFCQRIIIHLFSIFLWPVIERYPTWVSDVFHCVYDPLACCRLLYIIWLGLYILYSYSYIFTCYFYIFSYVIFIFYSWFFLLLYIL